MKFCILLGGLLAFFVGFSVAIFNVDKEIPVQDPQDPNLRIVGGNVSIKHQYPYQVSIQKFSLSKLWQPICSGSIIEGNKILTAAHCFKGYTGKWWLYRIVAGAHNIAKLEQTQQYRHIRQVFLHPKYSISTLDYDFAVVYIRKPLVLGEHVKKVQLPVKGSAIPTSGCTISGWGESNSGKFSKELRYVEMEMVTDCNTIYGTLITPQMICAKGKEDNSGTCVGDSGGPLMCENRFVGIASWTYGGCGSSKFPDVFGKVVTEVDWIVSV